MKFSIQNKTSEQIPDNEVLARLIAFEAIHDAMIDGSDATTLEVLENLQTLKAALNTDNAAIKAIISADIELMEMAAESKNLDNFKARIDSEIAIATETFGEDLWYGGILDALLHRKDTLLENLKPLVDKLLTQIKEADEKKFGEFKAFRTIAVFSKYLPNWNDWSASVKAVSNAAKYLISTDVKSFDINKFNGCFNGTVWAKKDGTVSKSNAVGSGKLIMWDIRKRGWTDKKFFVTALQDMSNLLKQMEALSNVLEKNKSAKIDDADKDRAKQYADAVTRVINMIGHLGRGITSAAGKITGSLFKRLFSTEN